MSKLTTLSVKKLMVLHGLGRNKRFYLASVAAFALALNSAPGLACGGLLEGVCKTVVKAVQDGGHAAETAAHDAGNAGQTAVQQAGHATETAAHDAGNAGQTAVQQAGHATETAAHQTGKAFEKAGQDTGKTIEKAVQDTGKAGETVYKFGVREIESIGASVKDADKRLKEGKVVDALWHLSTDQVKHTEENAAKATQESDLVRVAGQIAASAYGGPGGAAAYAAWLTYSQTKDVGLALRVGAITGAAAFASGAVGDMPKGAIVERLLMAGAIGGVAVAAAGGDKQAIQEGFLKAGGAVLVQSVYETQINHKLDARMSKGDAYCMASVDPNAACAPPAKAYEEIGPDGKAVVGKDGLPKVDVRETEPRAPHVGTWAKTADAPVIGVTETSKFMITVSKFPGMNAMALMHDHVSYTLQFDPVTNVATIVPAAAVTYYATGAPAEDQIRKAAQDDKKRQR